MRYAQNTSVSVERSRAEVMPQLEALYQSGYMPKLLPEASN